MFLCQTKVTAIECESTRGDHLLVAAGAIIPLFHFEKWSYPNIKEVLLFPAAFNEDFDFTDPQGRITGMVGNGSLSNKMILSLPALRLGFNNAKDKKNVAIHEFIHLIDMADGQVDGIPALLLNNGSHEPWVSLIQEKIREIDFKKSDITKSQKT